MSECKFKNVYVDMKGRPDEDIIQLYTWFIKAGALQRENVARWRCSVFNGDYFLGVNEEGCTYSARGCPSTYKVPLSEIESYLGLSTEENTSKNVPTFTWDDYDDKRVPPVGSSVTIKYGIAPIGGNTVEVVTPCIENAPSARLVVLFEGKYYLILSEYLLPITPVKSVREQKEDYLAEELGKGGFDEEDVKNILDKLENIK